MFCFLVKIVMHIGNFLSLFFGLTFNLSFSCFSVSLCLLIALLPKTHHYGV